MSTVTPPPHDAAVPPAPPERRCPRCGSTLAPDQEWCLACGAAAETEVAEPRGWRVPILLTGGLGLLAVIGVILLIVALASGPEKLAQATPTPKASVVGAVSPGSTAIVSPIPTVAPTTSPSPSETPSPGATETPFPSATPSPATSGSSSFPGLT